MNSLDIVKNLYHPYKITLRGNCKIIDSMDGKFVLKKENKDLFTLYSYLSSRGINNYPLLIRNFNEQENLIEYIDSINLPKEQYIVELSKTIANIHLKTMYDKSIIIDDVNTIKDNIENNINYLNDYYHRLVKTLILKEYLSPKDYFFIRNYHKIQESLDFCHNELSNWYSLCKDINAVRVSLLHNNLSLDHFIISNNKDILISWDNYRFDMPLLDIVYFINNSDYSKVEYQSFINTYFEILPYSDFELKLLFILISLPDNIYDNNLINLKNKVNKVNTIQELIRPYYSKDQKE